jgi:hypothetical protein
MSNLFKSKFFLGSMIVAAMFVVVGVVNTPKAAASCSITSTLKVGSKGADVKCLQSTLGLTADGSFGPKTMGGVKVWQKAHGLTADGVFGAKSRAVFNGGTVTTTLPAGCTSTSGFSPTTGANCSTGTTTTTTLPVGCVSATGYSSTTGQPCSSGTPVVTQTGPLTVSLATDNPAAGNLIQGQATADLAHFMFSGTGTITNLTLQRTGISDNSVFPNVYLYNGNTRLTDSASVNSQGQIVFNGLNIAVTGSLDLSVKADITSSTTNSESTVQVVLTSYTVSGGTATTVSVAGNSFYINSGTGILSTVAVGCNTAAGATGTQPNCTTNTTVNVSAGTTGYSLWSAPVSVSLHSVLLKSAAFDVIGSAPSNALANIGLYANGVQIGTSTGENSMGYITFDLTAAPYTLITGTTTLEVRADIVNGSARTLQLSLQHASDLMVTDSQVGVNVGVVNQAGVANPNFSINQSGTVSIQQGSLVAQSDPTFNSQTNVTGGASNIAIASYKLTSYGEDVKVNTVTVTPTISGTPSACSSLSNGAVGLNNVTLYYNGAPIGSSQNATLLTASTCTFNPLTFTPGSNLTVSGGTTGTFQIHADLVNGVGTPTYSSGSIGATVVISQYQGISSGQTSSLTLSGSNTMNITTGSLTVAQNSGFLGQTVSPNTSGAEIGSFTLQNQSTSEAVQVNSLTVGLTQTALGTPMVISPVTPYMVPLTNFSTLTLSGITGQAPTPIGQPTASNVFSTNFQIPAGGSVTVNVNANLGSTNGTGAPYTFYTSLLPTAVGASSRVTISSTAVAGQGIVLGTGSISAPTLVSSASTNAQYISTSGTGATNAAQETYNFVATTGSANIIGLKFAALTGESSTTAAGNGGTTDSQLVTKFQTATTTPLVVASTQNYVGSTTDTNFLVTTSGVYGGTNAVVTGHYTDSTHFLVTSIITPMVAGGTTVGASDGVPTAIYQLATSGVTGIALNSPGVATGSATFNGGIAYISAITGATGTGIAVPNNPSGVTVPVFMSFGPVNTNGGVASGSTGRIMLEYVQYQTGSNTSYLAPSASGTTLTLVGSKPTLTLNSSTAALTNGTSVLLGTVTVTADNGGDIALSEIPLSVSVNAGTSGTADVAVNSIKLTDTNGVSLGTYFTATNARLTNTSGSTSGSATEVFGDPSCTTTGCTTNHYRISAGTSKTFEIHANLSGDTFGTSATASVSLGTNTSFAWDDINGGSISDVAAGGTVNAGLTGLGLYNYPTGSVSIHN